jgi:hypothetical protein
MFESPQDMSRVARSVLRSEQDYGNPRTHRGIPIAVPPGARLVRPVQITDHVTTTVQQLYWPGILVYWDAGFQEFLAIDDTLAFGEGDCWIRISTPSDWTLRSDTYIAYPSGDNPVDGKPIFVVRGREQFGADFYFVEGDVVDMPVWDKDDILLVNTNPGPIGVANLHSVITSYGRKLLTIYFGGSVGNSGNQSAERPLTIKSSFHSIPGLVAPGTFLLPGNGDDLVLTRGESAVFAPLSDQWMCIAWAHCCDTAVSSGSTGGGGGGGAVTEIGSGTGVDGSLTIAGLTVPTDGFMVVALGYNATTGLGVATWGATTLSNDAAGEYASGAGLVGVRLYTGPVTAGTHDLTITGTASGDWVARAYLLTVTSQSLDVAGFANGTGTTPNSGSLAPAAASGEVGMGFVVTEGPDSDLDGSWDAPYINDGHTGTSTVRLSAATYIPTATTAESASKTGITSRNWLALQAYYK